MNNTITRERMAEILTRMRAAKNPLVEMPVSELKETTIDVPTIHQPLPVTQTLDKYGKPITLNDKQSKFITLGASGQSAILIGAAGTGKTTCQGALVTELIQTGKAGILQAAGHKHLLSETPGIIVCAFTRRAVANIRRNMPAGMQNNCITIHKLLEYQPVYYEVMGGNGEIKNTMKFEATRHADNPLSSSIHTIIFEETSMLGTDLYQEVINACPHNPQLIFLGDIQQLPPVFGPAILGFKLLELPTVELTDVYRQALESPIISLAHRILSGVGIEAKEFSAWKFPNQLTIRPWKKKISADAALNTVILMFCGNKHLQSDPAKQATGLHESGAYDPEEDMILIPFNKAFGTDELNKGIANYLAKINNSEVHQIIAGFNRAYFRVGEKVLFDKEDAVITAIEKNPAYAGVPFLPPSTTLDYWGHDTVRHVQEEKEGDDNIDFLLGAVASSDAEDRVKKCSHRITLEMKDSEREITIDTAGDVNALLYGYSLTVHKAQGSEWRKVFLMLHQSHATMLQRELLYTAVTRAREELFIVCEPETFVNGIRSQRVKGDTLAEKAEFFKGKIDAGFVLGGK
jgi:ATP-dependent exoDNAse (exonuclease V) alpha subunit